MDLRKCLVGGSPQARERWDQICSEGEDLERKWIAGLRSCGAVAAHPDDGWVNESDSVVEIMLAYPNFNDGVDVGSLIALGWPGKETRIVRVIGRRRTLFGDVWWRVSGYCRFKGGVARPVDFAKPA